MKGNLNLLWAKTPSPKVKQKGLSSLASFAISNKTKLSSTDNKFIWPSQAQASALDAYPQRKIWKS